MTHRNAVLGVVVIVASLSYGLHLKKQRFERFVKELEQKKEQKSFKKTFLGPRLEVKADTASVPLNPVLQRSESPECASFYQQVLSLDLSKGDAGSGNGVMDTFQFPKTGAGCVPKAQALSQALQGLEKACALPNEPTSEQMMQCQIQFLFLRGTVTRFQKQGKNEVNLAEITDKTELVDLLFSAFLKDGKWGGEPNWKELKAVSERLLEIEPGSAPAAKMLVGAKAIDTLVQGNVGSDSFAKLERDLERAQALNPSDPTLADLDVLVKTKGLDPELLEPYAKDLAKADPSSQLAHARSEFLLAYADWKRGNRETAVDSLKKAVSLDADNADYKAVLDKVSKPGAKVDDFKGTFKFGVGYGDFFR